MTNEEKDLLIAYPIDTGDIDPDGDVAGQFLDWYQVREGVGSGETHYKAVLEAARVRARSFEELRGGSDVPAPGGTTPVLDSASEEADQLALNANRPPPPPGPCRGAQAATPSARRARRSGGRRRRSAPLRTGTARCGAAGGWRRSVRESAPWDGPGTALPRRPAGLRRRCVFVCQACCTSWR